MTKKLQPLNRDNLKRCRIADHFHAAVAAGEWHPGDKLPTHAEIGRLFDASPLTVQKAFDDLAEDGLIVTRQGTRSRVAQKPPHLNRFAILLYGDSLHKTYHTEALLKSAEILKKKKGYRFDPYYVIDSHPLSFEYRNIINEMVSQHYAGAFLQATGHGMADFYAAVKDIPVTGFIQQSWYGDNRGNKHFIPLCCADYGETYFCRKIAEDNGKKTSVITFGYEAQTAPKIQKTLNEFDLSVPAGGIMVIPHVDKFPWYLTQYFKVMFNPENNDRPDSIILLSETFLPYLVNVLTEFYGKDAGHQVRIYCIANYPVLPKVDIPVHFAGFDLLEALDTGCTNIVQCRQGTSPRYTNLLIHDFQNIK